MNRLVSIRCDGNDRVGQSRRIFRRIGQNCTSARVSLGLTGPFAPSGRTVFHFTDAQDTRSNRSSWWYPAFLKNSATTWVSGKRTILLNNVWLYGTICIVPATWPHSLHGSLLRGNCRQLRQHRQHVVVRYNLILFAMRVLGNWEHPHVRRLAP